MFKVQEIASELCYSIRNLILWPHKQSNDCQIDIDHSEGAFHLGVFLDNELVCIGSFFKQYNERFTFSNQYRLRAMATLPKAQKRGIAKALIHFACDKLLREGQELLWCDARIIASQFYQKSGFSILGESYEIPIIGTHYLMYKKLSLR